MHVPTPAPKPGEWMTTEQAAQTLSNRPAGAVVTPKDGLVVIDGGTNEIEMLNKVSENMVPLDYGEQTHDGALHVKDDELIAGGF